MSSTGLAIGLTFLILGLLGLLISSFLFLHRRRLRLGLGLVLSSSSSPDSSFQNHRITPFGTHAPDSETPRFIHSPGQNMRIATRRTDGAWDFADPRAPFAPTGITDLDNVAFPSPTSEGRKFLFPPRSSSPTSTSYYGTGYGAGMGKRSSSPLSILSSSGKEKRGSMVKKGFEYNPSVEVLPPPAYVYGHPHSDPYSPGSV